MSQAIPAFTPLQSPYPYQGNPQQQISAALASSSSGMPGDSIAPIVVGVAAGGLLTAAAVTLAVKHFSTSGKNPKPAQVISSTSKPVKRAEATQIESARTLAEERTSSQPTSPFQPVPQSQATQLPTPPLPLLPLGENHRYITIPGFPGFIDEYGVYRERQIGGLCGMHAYNTVRYAFGMEPLTQEKFEEQVSDPGTRAIDLFDLSDRDGLDARVHFPAQFGGAGIGNTKAFTISLKSPYTLEGHVVAIVYSEITRRFHLSESGDQDKAKSEIYSGTATEALLEYLRRNNLTADAVDSVLTFHERVPVQGVVPRRIPSPLR